MYTDIILYFLIIVLILYAVYLVVCKLKSPPSISGSYDNSPHSISNITNEVLKIFGKQLQDLSSDGIEYYKKLKNPRVAHIDVNSDALIQTILKYGSPNEYYRLLSIISKHVNTYDTQYRSNIGRILANKSITDTEFFNQIKKYARKHDPVAEERIVNNKNKKRAYRYYNKIKKIINVDNPKFKINHILDVGCGTCKFTQALGKEFKLDLSQIHGTDIKSWVTKFDEESIKKLDIDFKYIVDGKLPFDDNQFDIITSLMVLHHVEDLDKLFNEIKRCLKPGGYFVIREHDAVTVYDHILTDIEHELYSILMRGKTIEQFRKEYYAKYHDWMEWDTILSGYSFKRLHMEYDAGGIINDITPTRYYFAIYKMNP